MFQSTQFAIENRPGVEDQTLDNVMAQLQKLDAPSLHPGIDSYKKIDLAKWLSDWHLVAFLETSQLFSPVCLLLYSAQFHFLTVTFFFVLFVG